MLTRREFLRLLAALSGTALAPACLSEPLIPTSAATTLIPPTPPPIQTSFVTPTSGAAATTPATGTPSATATRLPSPTVTPTHLQSTLPEDFISVRGDQFYYRGSVFPIKGFNYYPRMHPWRTFNVGEWEPEVTERELRLGVGLGANTVRMVVDYQFSLDNSRAQQVRDNYFAPIGQYVANIREFIDIAGRLGLRVIFTLFDSLDWAMYQPVYHWIAEEYLKELVPSFANDPTILCWDLQNEPDRAIVLVGNTNVIPFFQRISKLVRRLAPRQLQTIGWIDRARARYFPDFDDLLDFWCFHFYDSTSRLNDLVAFYKSKTSKPVLLEEFGLPTGGPGRNAQTGEQDQVAHYRTVLQTLKDNGTCGSVFWILNDFPVGLAGNPPSPEDSPENHFGIFRLDYSEKPAAMVLRDFWRPNRRSGE